MHKLQTQVLGGLGEDRGVDLLFRLGPWRPHSSPSPLPLNLGPGQGGHSHVHLAQSREQFLNSRASESSELHVWPRVGAPGACLTLLGLCLGFHCGSWAGPTGPPSLAFPTVSLGAADALSEAMTSTQESQGQAPPRRSQGWTCSGSLQQRQELKNHPHLPLSGKRPGEAWLL